MKKVGGWSVTANGHKLGDGIILHAEGEEIFLDNITAGMLAKTVALSRKNYWKRFRLPVMKEQKCGEK